MKRPAHKRSRLPSHIALLFLVAMPLRGLVSAPLQMMATAANPDSDHLPTLSLWADDKSNPGHPLTMVSDPYPEALLRRVNQDFPAAGGAGSPTGPAGYETAGVRDRLPVFYERLASRMDYPLSWLSGRHGDFAAWRDQARAKVTECLLRPPPVVPFEPKVIAEQDRGSYVARKVVFNVTGDSRVLAFMLVPKAAGPHPAVLLLHDHGARFDIGKEKVIEPWDEPVTKMESARKWIAQYYGGRFIGDELAKRGYVCLATDMLNWSDRGGGGYENQQALAANLFQLGASWAGLIAQEDLRAAEFLATRPEVDGRRVAAMGLSVGGYRTWQTAALSDRIAAGVSVCWMATRKGLMVPGNNQTTGQSAFTMIHPGLANLLDYPDVASIACPKPMMFLCGSRDQLFPVKCIEEAFAKMRRVWESQQAADRLATRLYDAPHEFNATMQKDAFDWLDHQLKPAR
jgi:dienelactone hydrolase